MCGCEKHWDDKAPCTCNDRCHAADEAIGKLSDGDLIEDELHQAYAQENKDAR